ncbi:MAG: GAF domain-containing protein [Gammaproteobacteria bacterium]|nr:GAF domain-containing protein [Gammaproteobacteria bacterium]
MPDNTSSTPSSNPNCQNLLLSLLLSLTILLVTTFWINLSDNTFLAVYFSSAIAWLISFALAARLFWLVKVNKVDPYLNIEYKTHPTPGIDPIDTSELQEQTRSLEILYDVATNINASSNVKDLLSRFVLILKDIAKADAAAVRLLKEDGTMELVASIGLSPEAVESERNRPADCSICGSVISAGQIRIVNNTAPCQQAIGHNLLDNTEASHIAVPLRFQDKVVGVYNLFVNSSDHFISENTQNLLSLVGNHLGTAIEKTNLEEKARRVLVMHERTMIANELHDSLAQTLASLRFQVRVLDETLQQSGEYQSIHGIEQVEHSLDEAYTDLRELIAHCRTPIAEQGVVNSIEKLISRFRKETDIHILLQNEWGNARLPANMEMHIYRIVQEALTNIRKHSLANNVRVLLYADIHGEYRILIENDGKGFDQPQTSNHKGEHIGLTIMKERAKHLGGELDLESDPEEGTRIEVNFHYNDEPQIKLGATA